MAVNISCALLNVKGILNFLNSTSYLITYFPLLFRLPLPSQLETLARLVFALLGHCK
jgi:hypothetical protein